MLIFVPPEPRGRSAKMSFSVRNHQVGIGKIRVFASVDQMKIDYLCLCKILFEVFSQDPRTDKCNGCGIENPICWCNHSVSNTIAVSCFSLHWICIISSVFYPPPSPHSTYTSNHLSPISTVHQNPVRFAKIQ